MGFGLLLIGYIFSFVMTVGLGNYLFAGMLIGGFIMHLGFSELKKYSPVFIYALIFNVVFLLCAFFEATVWIDSQLLLGLPFANDIILKIFDVIELIVNLLLNLSILYGIADLSRRVDLSETRKKAFRNMFFVGFFNFYQLLMILPISIFESDKPFFMTVLLILQFLYTVINAFLIFKCYAKICPVGQEDPPIKKSRLEFINKFRSNLDEREQRAIESTKKFYEDRNNKKQEQKNIHHGSKRKNKKKK